jgi:hypothetical protein
MRLGSFGNRAVASAISAPKANQAHASGALGSQVAIAAMWIAYHRKEIGARHAKSRRPRNHPAWSDDRGSRIRGDDSGAKYDRSSGCRRDQRVHHLQGIIHCEQALRDYPITLDNLLYRLPDLG